MRSYKNKFIIQALDHGLPKCLDCEVTRIADMNKVIDN